MKSGGERRGGERRGEERRGEAQVWAEGELKLHFMRSISFSLCSTRKHTDTHTHTLRLGLMDAWGLLSHTSQRSFNLPTHLLSLPSEIEEEVGREERFIKARRRIMQGERE